MPVSVTYSCRKWETQPDKEAIKVDGKVRECFCLVCYLKRWERPKEMGEVADTMQLRRKGSQITQP